MNTPKMYTMITHDLFDIIMPKHLGKSLVAVLQLSNQKQPSCKKRCGPQKGHGEKRCEIQGGGQEMAVMVG